MVPSRVVMSSFAAPVREGPARATVAVHATGSAKRHKKIRYLRRRGGTFLLQRCSADDRASLRLVKKRRVRGLFAIVAVARRYGAPFFWLWRSGRIEPFKQHCDSPTVALVAVTTITQESRAGR